MSVVLWGVLIAVFGPALIPFVIIQAVFGFSLLETVNYLEHYGLLRQKNANGRYERCTPVHSWNSDHIVTNLFLYHLQRHSDHHANPTRRYQTLRSMAGAPNLPSGYASMISLTYFPPLWRKVMDHRVLEHYDGDITRVNLQPRLAREAAGPSRGGGMRAAYRCPVCALRLRRGQRRAREGFPAGTRWEQVPDDWCCPDCAVREKTDFEQIGVTNERLQAVSVRPVRLRVRRGAGLARRRHRARHPLGRHPRGLELPGLRRGQVGLRDGGSGTFVTDLLAPVKRTPYAEASRALLRDSVLDAMRDLLLTRDWSAITLSDVARAAGISRQTIYNEFGSRQGLAQGYALRLADRLVDTVEAAMDANVGDIYAALLQGFRQFFAESAADPLVISLLTGVAKPDLLQLITTDSAPIITRASARLVSAFNQTWVAISDEDAGVISRAIVRLCLSYVSMPPESDHDVAADLARLLAPFVERHGVIGVAGP